MNLLPHSLMRRQRRRSGRAGTAANAQQDASAAPFSSAAAAGPGLGAGADPMQAMKALHAMLSSVAHGGLEAARHLEQVERWSKIADIEMQVDDEAAGEGCPAED